MKERIDVSIIILTYNTRTLTLQCLQSLSETAWGDVTKEIIVVDNASNDATVDSINKLYSDVILVRNSKNLGFAKANNIGIRRAKGRYILLLNSDTEVEKDSIPAMIAFMDSHPKAGVSTPRVLLSDGTLDPACHRGFPNPWAAFTYMSGLERLFPKSRLFSQYHLGYKTMTLAHTIDVPSGAFFLVRRVVIDQVGMLDEDYFMYGEDIDWAYRIKEKGWEIWFNPTASILHRKKQSGRAHGDAIKRMETENYFLTTMKLFYKKHYEQVYPRVITCLVYLVLDLRILILSALGIKECRFL